MHRHTPGDFGSALHTFDEHVLIIRRSRSLLAATVAPAVFGAALARTGLASGAAVGAVLVWLAMGLLFHVWRRNPFPRQLPARARADARGLFIDGRLLLESSRIRGGWLQPKGCGPPVVRVCARGVDGHVDLAVRDRESGRALLRALELDPTHSTARYWTMARPLAERRLLGHAVATIALVVVFGFLAGHSTAAALALAVVALVVFVVGAAAPTRVTVGADGVLVEWLGTARFVSWSSVAAIEAFEHGVVLALESGRWLTLRTPGGHGLHPLERDGMRERMHVAWRACARARSDDPAARLTRRAGGHTREWVRAMRGLSTDWNGYRTVGMPAGRLWTVVEDPAADRTSRTGAALALAPSLDATGRNRLCAAAASCAEPRLRVALTTAATAAGATVADDDLAAALDAIESEGQDEEAEQSLAGP